MVVQRLSVCGRTVKGVLLFTVLLASSSNALCV
jgi:hypothetical protein